MKLKRGLQSRVWVGVLMVSVTALLLYGGWELYRAFFVSHKLEETEFVTAEERQEAEGRDETEREETIIDNYTVAPDQPRIITAASINMRARVLPMGVNPDNSMQAPLNIFDSGWYIGSAKPGEPGAVVIDGHASGPTRQGLFAYIDTLQAGDLLTIERGDAKIFTYEVVYVTSVSLSTIDMKEVLRPYGDATYGLNLITCSGTWIEDQQTYDERVLVYAVGRDESH